MNITIFGVVFHVADEAELLELVADIEATKCVVRLGYFTIDEAAEAIIERREYCSRYGRPIPQ